MKKILTRTKDFFVELVKDKNNKLSFEKLIVILSVLNVVIQLGFIGVHNKGGLKVSQTVTIYSFICLICLLLCTANSLRLKEGKRYYIYSFIFIGIILFTGILYISICLTDKNYLDALGGVINNPHLILWPIQDSVALMVAGVSMAFAILVLSITELVLISKRR